MPRTCPPSLILSLSCGLAGDGCVGPVSSSWWCFFLCFFLCFLCFFLCTPWTWAPARVNSSASPAEGESVNSLWEERDSESAEEPSTPKRSPSSRGTRCYHNNSPTYLLPPVAKYPGSSEELLFFSFVLRRSGMLHRLALTWLRGLHSPRDVPASPQLTHEVLLREGTGNDLDTRRHAFSAPRKN